MYPEKLQSVIEASLSAYIDAMPSNDEHRPIRFKTHFNEITSITAGAVKLEDVAKKLVKAFAPLSGILENTEQRKIAIAALTRVAHAHGFVKDF